MGDITEMTVDTYIGLSHMTTSKYGQRSHEYIPIYRQEHTTTVTEGFGHVTSYSNEKAWKSHD